jgi:hypothetical protein
VCRAVLLETRLPYLFVYLSIHLPRPVYLTVRMSGELTELEKYIEEVLKKFIVYIPMSEGLNALSTRELHASFSTGRRSGHVNLTTKQ